MKSNKKTIKKAVSSKLAKANGFNDGKSVNIQNSKYNQSANSANNQNMRSHNRKVFRILLFLFAVMLIGIFATLIVYNTYYLIDYAQMNASVKVVPRGLGGLNNDVDSMKFGKIGPGNGGMRYFTIHPTMDALVKIKATGDMAKFLSFSENNFEMKNGEYKQITAFIDIPEDTAYGNYSGKIQVYFFRP